MTTAPFADGNELPPNPTLPNISLPVDGMLQAAETTAQPDRRENFARTAGRILAAAESMSDAQRETIENILRVTPGDLAGLAGNHIRLENKNGELETRLATDEKTGAWRFEAAENALTEVAISSVKKDRPMFCLLADLDGLKAANDCTDGAYSTGDEYIVTVADAIREYFGGKVALIRMNGENGDEFFIVGLMKYARRISEDKHTYEDELLETQAALRQFVSQTVKRNPVLIQQARNSQSDGKTPELELDSMGISVGGVYIEQEDVEAIGEAFMSQSVSFKQVFSGLRKRTHTLMKQDKIRKRQGLQIDSSKTELRLRPEDVYATAA